MIEKMKSVCIVSVKNAEAALLYTLRELGVLHVSSLKNPDSHVAHMFSELTRTRNLLSECSSSSTSNPVLSQSQFEELHKSVIKAVEGKKAVSEELHRAQMLCEQLACWGNFVPSQILDLEKEGIELHFYKMGKKEYQDFCKNDNVNFIKLSPVEKQIAVAVIGPQLDSSVPASEFRLPEKGLKELEAEVADLNSKIQKFEKTIEDASKHLATYDYFILKCKNEVSYSSVSETVQKSEDGLVWITGYIPVSECEKFAKTASANNWAFAMDDPADDDENVPTKVKYTKFTGLLKPVMDILGTVPGYREFDISFWFLSFFAVFFAMIIGDAGYGVIFLLLGIGLNIKKKKADDLTVLLYLLSGTTIVWGAFTGTWFGLEQAMQIGFLRKLVIPAIANYPQYFGVDSVSAQNTLMQLCFMLGTIQLTLACCINIKTKLQKKDLSVLADLGWLFSINGLYYIVLLLVINATENIKLCAVFVVLGFLLVCLFGGMSPDKTFKQGLKAGLGDAFTNFLNTISAFGNIMSYIRLFAVGLASLAIAQSFNNMASGFSGPLVVVGAAIMIIGHTLNLVMGLLSVVVHGVRLNLLEFSGQLGMEWSGIAYEPFRKLDK